MQPKQCHLLLPYKINEIVCFWVNKCCELCFVEDGKLCLRLIATSDKYPIYYIGLPKRECRRIGIQLRVSLKVIFQLNVDSIEHNVYFAIKALPYLGYKHLSITK